MKQLLILAGGKGTRLRDRLGDLPKPLVDICGKPLLERQIILAKHYHFEKITLLIGYGAHYIRDFCGDGSQWGVSIDYIEESEPLGTGGAVLAILDQLEDRFLIMYGDTMLNVDLARFWNEHAAKGADVTLFLHPNDHPQDSDLVDVDEQNYIRKFYPYPHSAGHYYPNLVNAALYVIEKKALQNLAIKARFMDFAKDIFPILLDQHKKLFGYQSFEYIKDIGTPARLDKVCAQFRSGYIAKASLALPQAAIFLDRDGTLNMQRDYVRSPSEFQLLPGVALAIKKINLSPYLAVLVSNQPVIARGDCSLEVLKQIHNKMETELGEKGAYLDRIYFCPHHPDKGFTGERIEYKIDCECRKPKVGMLMQAQRDLNIDFSKSWLIGDSTTDLETAKNAHIKSILVKTGEQGVDGRFTVLPDYQFTHLEEAVDFIITQDRTMV